MSVIRLFALVLIALFSDLSIGKSISQTPSGDSLNIVEKVYLHIDRDTYYPGDDLWFKAYLINAAERILSDHSQNLHVELISPALKIVDSRIVKLTAGLANGDFHLSEKLNSGRYRLRAYTNYMRNFGNELFFNKDISIIDPADSAKSISDSLKFIKNKLEISFFPEGGSLVENVPSLIAFKATDANGVGCDVTGEISSSTGELVTSFKSAHKGMGTFLLKPVTGLNYFATVRNRYGNVVKTAIPSGFKTGIALNLYRNSDDELIATFKTNAETLPLIPDHDLTLTISSRNIVFKSLNLRLESLENYLILPVSNLTDGIYSVTLSGIDNIPLCERLVFIKNDDEPGIKIETDKPVYNQRDSVSVRIILTGDSPYTQDAFLSLSATDNMFTADDTGFPSTISSWFLLESDVRGQVEEPSYYFDHSNATRLKDLDLLLLTQGWRDFEWKYKKMIYPPEYGFTISGRVRKKFADVPLKNSFVNIGIFGIGKPLIRDIPTDTAGKFSFGGLNLTGNAQLIASVTDEKDKLKGMLLLDSVTYAPARIALAIDQTKINWNSEELIDDDQLLADTLVTKKNLHKFIQYAEIKSSVRKKYKLSDTIDIGEVKIIARRIDEPESARARSRRYLRGTPDKELVITPILENYNNVFQLVDARFLGHTKLVGLGAWMLNPKMMNPMYMIDGQRAEISDVKSLPLKLVERIDVTDNPASFLVLRTISSIETTDSAGVPRSGLAYFDGAISIILKDPDDPVFDKTLLHSARSKISGFYEPRIFYSPKHNTPLEKDYKPDLRTTLYWEPNIEMENNKDVFLNYFNADNPSMVKITVEGITSKGIPVTGTAEYEVK
jgi:hypothetical protein